MLTNGGHNAGIISEPGHEGRKFEIKTVFTSEYNLEPEEWGQQADKKTGSWWLTLEEKKQSLKVVKTTINCKYPEGQGPSIENCILN